MKNHIARFAADNIVGIVVLLLIVLAVPASGYTAAYLVQELVVRLNGNAFLVLSLLLPIMTGMGLNFGMVLGTMAGQIGLILVLEWNIIGIPGLTLASMIAMPIAVILGYMSGLVLNRAKGREMVTSFVLGFFMNGLYQLVALYGMGTVIPIESDHLLLARGYGIRNRVNLDVAGMRQALDSLLLVRTGPIEAPVLPFILIGLICLFIGWLRTTKLGQDIRAAGQDVAVSEAAGIPVNRIRVVSIIISTLLACFGQVIFLQNMGTMDTYGSHDQSVLFAVAALLVGGASVARATIPNVFVGVILFHLLLIVLPTAGNRVLGQAQSGEFLSKFVTYGIIAVSLVLHVRRRRRKPESALTVCRKASDEAEATP